jgi:hypothetical protein
MQKGEPINYPIGRPRKEHVTHLSTILKLTNVSIFQAKKYV